MKLLAIELDCATGWTTRSDLEGSLKSITFHEIEVDLGSVFDEFHQCFGFRAAEVFAHRAGSNNGLARLKSIREERIEQRLDDGYIDGRANWIAEISVELEVHPLRVIGIGMVAFDIPFDPTAFDHVVMGPENGVEGRHEGTHIQSVDPAGDIVVRCTFQTAISVEVALSGHFTAGKEVKIRLIQDAVNNGWTDKVCVGDVRRGDRAVWVKQRIGGTAPEDRGDTGVGHPIPVGQSEIRVPG